MFFFRFNVESVRYQSFIIEEYLWSLTSLAFPLFYAQKWIALIALRSVALFWRASGAIFFGFSSESLIFYERIAPVALYKGVTVSESFFRS